MRDEIRKIPTPDSHVDSESGAKTMVYNTKRNSKRRRWKNRKKKERLKKHNSKKERTLNY